MNSLVNNFEAGKIYKVTYPDGRVLIVKLTGGYPLKFQTKNGSVIRLEQLEGYKSVEVIDDEFYNM